MPEYTAEICDFGSTGWMISHRLKFNNFNRFYTFVRYYTQKHPENIIRIYHGFYWVQTYMNGKDIWNCW